MLFKSITAGGNSMITVMPETHGNILSIKASGKLTDQDYKEVYIPMVEAAIKEFNTIRLLFFMDDSFAGWDLSALWDDAKYGMKYKDNFEKLAVVGGAKWIDTGIKLFAHFMEGEVKTFSGDQLAAAWSWLQS
jgi:SpoIIAA-like